ncbi:5872_t:CDS:1, partial [Rhizophagus irregularis]
IYYVTEILLQLKNQNTLYNNPIKTYFNLYASPPSTSEHYQLIAENEILLNEVPS